MSGLDPRLEPLLEDLKHQQNLPKDAERYIRQAISESPLLQQSLCRLPVKLIQAFLAVSGRLRRPTGCADGRTRWGSHRPCFPSNN